MIRIDRVVVEWSDDPETRNAESCKAIAEVSYECSEDGDRRIEWLSSGGLHGIDQRSTAKYKQTIEDEELTDLRAHLEQFNIDTSTFPRNVIRSYGVI